VYKSATQEAMPWNTTACNIHKCTVHWTKK